MSTRRETLLLQTLWSGHVHESRIMALECDRHGGGWAIPVLGHNQIRLARPRRLPLVSVLAVQKDDDVAILFDTVVADQAVGDEVVRALHRGVVDGLWSQRLDAHDPVPVEIAAGDLTQRLGVKCLRTAHEAFS